MDVPGEGQAGVLLRNLLDDDPHGIFFTDAQGRIVRASRAFAVTVGYDGPEALVGRDPHAWFAVPPDDAELPSRIATDVRSVLETGVPVVELHEHRSGAGEYATWIATSLHPLRDDEGAVIGVFGELHDITAQKRVESLLELQAVEMARANAELRRAEGELRTMLEANPDATVRLDGDLRVIYANPAAGEMYGADPAEMLNHSLYELAEYTGGVSTVQPFEAAIRQVMETGEPIEYEGAAIMHGGTLFLHTRVVPERDRMGTICGALVVGRDLTARKRVEDLLAERALRDPLTGLANRSLVFDRLRGALARMRRAGKTAGVAVLFLDLDGFKAVNDSLGHAVGDALLAEVARRLTHSARRSDTVARFGGDEFVLVCEDVPTVDGVLPVAHRILEELRRPFAVDGTEVTPGASLGIALTTDPDLHAEVLVRNADDAMYQAKSRGGGTYQVFDATVRSRVASRRGMEGELRDALERGDFRLLYQPIVTLAERELVGVEALVRWARPDGTLTQPAHFIPLAEETGLILPLGLWVLEEAVTQVAAWNATLRRGREPLSVAVNVSARQLLHPDLADEVAAVLARHDFPARLLTLEIAETVMLEESAMPGDVVGRLAALGVDVALDDFGTGYSSLGHLRRLPVRVLKIDRIFVEGLAPGSGESAIVAAVTAMARALGIRTVGEGIETNGQLAALAELGCEDGQGFLIARPLDAAEIEARYLSARARRSAERSQTRRPPGDGEAAARRDLAAEGEPR